MSLAQAYGGGVVVANAAAHERADFIRKTYLHLGGAILAFAALQVFAYQAGISEALTRTLLATKYSWLIVMVGFMGVSWIANAWAQSPGSVGKQYAGLGLYVVAQGVIMMPILWIAAKYCGPETIPSAIAITVALCVGLTAAVFITGADFSFLRSFLMFGGFVALGFIVCSIIFGFNLGLIFTAVMLVLACGYILYDTSNVLHHYHTGQHVAASLALFASVALLFYYVLRLVMSLSNRE